MLVPFATCSSGPCSQALRGLELPHLRKLLRRLVPEGDDAGRADSLSPPHERALARAHGLAAADGAIPLAALQVLQAGGDPGGAAWAWITPAHWRVGQDRIQMTHPGALLLEEQESRAMLAAMLPYFAGDGIELEYHEPLRWLARGDIFRALPSASLDRVIGRDIEDGWMPSGPAGRTVRRLQQEMQMLLYTLPLNDERQARGLLPVNTFWVSGTGALPAQHVERGTAGVQFASSLRDAALLGDADAWAAAWQQLDGTDCARLLGASQGGDAVRVTLCGEAGARTWGSGGASAWRRIGNWFAASSPAHWLEGL